MNGSDESSRYAAGQHGLRIVQSLAFLVALVLSLVVSLAFWLASAAPSQAQAAELNGKINPNTASVGSLVRLPGIGPGRAGAIVAYREQFAAQNPGSRVFEKCDDLQKVKGIGPKTAAQLCPYLIFAPESIQ